MKFKNWDLFDLIEYLRKADFSRELNNANNGYTKPKVSGEIVFKAGKKEEKRI